jgi:two-component system sensor histidine kinase FlrB
MKQQQPLSTSALQEAFQTFNQLSSQLAGSYHALEERVNELNVELARSQDARIRELNEKERLANRLSTLLQALPGGVVVLDGDGRVQEFNQAALDLLGQPLKGQSWGEVINRAFSPRNDDGHDISLVDGRRVNISTCPMVNEPGQILLITDVTEMRIMQDRLSHHQRLVAMGEMAASLAHQIRTPLASALLYSSNLKRDQLEKNDRLHYAEKIRSRLALLEHIVTDMLLYSRNQKSGSIEVFPVSELLLELEHQLDMHLQTTSTTFSIQSISSDIKISGNRQILVSALSNLGVNAIQAMGRNGKLCISTELQDEEQIVIKVADNGPGIIAEKLEQIFEPFFTTRAEGTGLGLAVVQAVINTHNGDISVESEKNAGTTFTIRLPAVKEQNNETIAAQGMTEKVCNVG